MPDPARVATARVIRVRRGKPTLEREAIGAPAAGEILLAVTRSGLCGTDLFKLAHGLAEGLVLGHEVAGRVVAAGPGVEGIAPGDRLVVAHHAPCGECALCRRGSEPLCPAFKENLLAPGGFASHLVVRRRALATTAHRLPVGVGDDSGAFVEPAACVLRGLARSGWLDLPADERLRAPVGVLGAGAMGLLHGLLIRALAPQAPVVLVEPEAARRAGAAELGFSTDDEAREDAGYDIVFDTAGGGGPLAASLRAVRPGGTVVLFAHGARDETAELPLNDLFHREVRIVTTYSSAPHEQRTVLGLLADGRFDPLPLVTHVLPLDRFAEGLALARDRRALKVLFAPEATG